MTLIVASANPVLWQDVMGYYCHRKLKQMLARAYRQDVRGKGRPCGGRLACLLWDKTHERQNGHGLL